MEQSQIYQGEKATVDHNGEWQNNPEYGAHQYSNYNLANQNVSETANTWNGQTYVQPGVGTTQFQDFTSYETGGDSVATVAVNPQQSQLGVIINPTELPRWKWIVFGVSIFLTMTLLGYDTSNIANIQVSIYDEFKQIELLPWVNASFALANGASAPFMRRLMDLSDLKWFSAGSLIISMVGGIVVGAAKNMSTAVAGRVLVGIGIAGAYLSELIILKSLTTPLQFTKLNGIIGAGFAVGLVTGPVIGAAFAENKDATWRWAFYITGPWVALIVVLNSIAFPSIRFEHKDSIWRRLLNIDWVGAVLHVATAVLFVCGCLFPGISWEWNSAASIVTWVMFGVVAIAYMLQQYFCWFTTPEQRIFPICILEYRIGFWIFIATACTTASYGITLYYPPIYFAFTRGDGAMQAAVHILPFICCFIAFSLASGILLPKIGIYAIIYLLSGVLITAGAGALMVINESTPTQTFLGITTLIGGGVGLTFSIGPGILPIVIPSSLQADIFVASNQSMYLAISWALAIAGAIYNNRGFNRLKDALGETDFTDAQIRETLAGLKSPILHGSDHEISSMATSIVADVIMKNFYMVLAAGILMMIAAGAMKWERLQFGPPSEKSQEAFPATEESTAS